MLQILSQKTFDLVTEEGILVLSNDTSNSVVASVIEKLQASVGSEMQEDLLIIHSLGRLKTPKVVFINTKKLTERAKRKECFQKIAELKNHSCILIDTFSIVMSDEFLYDLVDVIHTKNYSFQTFKSKKDSSDRKFFLYGDLVNESVIAKASACALAVSKAKDLTNTPYNYMNASTLGDEAKKLEKFDHVQVTIIEKPEIESMNMGLFLGVNLGSLDEPKLIYIRYQGLDTFDNPTALIGKGVMYDTGGYSLKTSQSMPGMKGDMAGAASVISAIQAIAELKLKVNVMGIVCATDNRIGENAIVPDDILTSAKGLTVEIISTDAEGRLTLADALWFAQKEGSKEIIDVATLTGAIISALGDEFTGAFTNAKPFLHELEESSKFADEPIWEMPISKGYHKDLKSDVADLKNKGGAKAGASVAAAFLEEFVEKDTSWIHLDIAATSNVNNNATGVMVKTFVEFFDRRSK